MKIRHLRPRIGNRDGIFSVSVPGVSAEAQEVAESLERAFEHWTGTETYRRHSLEAEFSKLAAWWKADTEDESSPQRIAIHPAYQSIIGLGPVALPYILRDLADTHDQWFWALHAIARQDPVPAGARGNIHKMVEHWMRWGRQNNIV